MAGNRIQIRRGSGTPSDLLGYELGWDYTNKILYIANVENNAGILRKIGGEGAFLPLSGGTLSGTLHFKGITTSNYTEGIRLHPSTNGWNAIVFCGTDNTGDNGTSANTWGLYTNQGNFSISKNQSQSGTAYLQNINNAWVLGGPVTTTGDLTISKSNTCLYLQNPNMDTSTTTNSVSAYNQIFFTDKNGRLNGFIQGCIDLSASAYLHFGVRTRNSANSDNLQQHFSIVMAKDGTASTSFTHPAAWRAGLSVPAMTTESYPALLPTNGANNWIKVGTANSSYGLLPSQAGGAGSGHNYIGTSSWYWGYLYCDQIYSIMNTISRSNHNADVGIIVQNTDSTNPLKLGYIIGTSGIGGIYDYTHSAWKVQIAANGTTTFNGTATTGQYLWTGAANPVYGTNRLEYFNSSGTTGTPQANATSYPTSDWYHFIRMNHGNSNGYYVELAACFHNEGFYYRRVANGTAYAWNGIVKSDLSRRIYVTTSASVPSGAVAGDIVLVKA